MAMIKKGKGKITGIGTGKIVVEENGNLELQFTEPKKKTKKTKKTKNKEEKPPLWAYRLEI